MRKRQNNISEVRWECWQITTYWWKLRYLLIIFNGNCCICFTKLVIAGFFNGKYWNRNDIIRPHDNIMRKLKVIQNCVFDRRNIYFFTIWYHQITSAAFEYCILNKTNLGAWVGVILYIYIYIAVSLQEMDCGRNLFIEYSKLLQWTALE